MSPDGKSVYVAAELDSAVAQFSRNLSTGNLTFIAAIKDGAGSDGLRRASSLTVSPDGRHVYVGNEITHDQTEWIAILARNESTGALSYVSGLPWSVVTVDGFGIGPTDSGVVVSPDNLRVYVANPWLGAVATFDRNPTSGGLTLIHSLFSADFESFAVPTPRSLAIDPLGRHVYVGGGPSSTLAVTEVLLNDSTRITTLDQAPNGSIDIDILGTPHRTYRLTSSPNLMNWGELTSGKADERGRLRLNAIPPGGQPEGFWRVER